MKEYKNRIDSKKIFKNKGLRTIEEKRHRNLAVGCVVTAVIFVSTLGFSLAPKKQYTNPGITKEMNFTVAHAGGGLTNEKGKKLTYLNCLEAFDEYYERGTRIFEYDLAFSSDNKLISTHRYEYLPQYSDKNKISYDEFCKTKIEGVYTGITEDTLFDLIRNYPDCKFIIDTKEDNETLVYQRLVNKANEEELDISSSMIPFVFSTEMLDDLEKMYDFKEYMFTNYKENYSSKKLLEIIDSNDKINYLHIFPLDFFKADIEEVNKRGVRVFAHMDKNTIFKTPLRYGCTGVFTDDITEEDFKDNYYDFMTKKLTPIKQTAENKLGQELPIVVSLKKTSENDFTIN